MTEILFVCTGNIIRSAVAAAVAQRIAHSRALPVKIQSAGMLRAGQPASEEAVAASARRGLDLSAHRSTHFSTCLDPCPDLVITMARQHSRAVVDPDLSRFKQTFTLKEFVRLGRAGGPREPDEPIPDYLRRLGAGRSIAQLSGMVSNDDIADPIGAGRKAHRRCVDEIENLVIEMINLLFA